MFTQNDYEIGVVKLTEFRINKSPFSIQTLIKSKLIFKLI